MTLSQGTEPPGESTPNATPPPLPNRGPQRKEKASEAVSLDADASFGQVLDAIMKRPMTVITRFRDGNYGGVSARLAVITLIAIAVYSLVVASFSGEEQWYFTPVKCAGGLFITMLICLPSMHIFACLSGAEITFGASASLMLKAVTLSAILLTGFAPVAWVFSQSTNSVYVMGMFHLIFWAVSMLFGMKVLLKGITLFHGGQKKFMFCWIVIFLITSLQMMTALRPIIGRSTDILPTKKTFFLEHWYDTAFTEKR